MVALTRVSEDVSSPINETEVAKRHLGRQVAPVRVSGSHCDPKENKRTNDHR